MAAVIDIRTGSGLLAPSPGRASQGPRLHLIEGGRSPAALKMRRVYVVRRLVASGVAVVVLTGLCALVLSTTAALWGASAASGAAVAGTSSASQVHYVVRPGDTLWGIAAALRPDADPRDVVRSIISLNADDPGVAEGRLSVGQQLDVPSSGG